jgi:hypothetical protein
LIEGDMNEENGNDEMTKLANGGLKRTNPAK